MSSKSFKSIIFFSAFFFCFNFKSHFTSCVLPTLSTYRTVTLITLYCSYFLSVYLPGSQFSPTHSHITPPPPAPANTHTLYSQALETKPGLIHFSMATQAKYPASHGHSVNTGYMGGWMDKHQLFPLLCY